MLSEGGAFIYAGKNVIPDSDQIKAAAVKRICSVSQEGKKKKVQRFTAVSVTKLGFADLKHENPASSSMKANCTTTLTTHFAGLPWFHPSTSSHPGEVVHLCRDVVPAVLPHPGPVSWQVRKISGLRAFAWCEAWIWIQRKLSALPAWESSAAEQTPASPPLGVLGLGVFRLSDNF